jgi:hypothetical protein
MKTYAQLFRSTNYDLHLAASTKAVLITLRGSMIPSFTMSTYTPVLHTDHYYLSGQESKEKTGSKSKKLDYSNFDENST